VTGSDGERRLQRRYGTQERAQRFYDNQLLDHLNPAMRDFIARQEMMFLATSDSHGECDNSFRAGPPGFVRTLEANRLAWPEYRGNGVLASLGNVAENPHVGLLFVDFFDDGVGLHVNGTAMIVDDHDMRRAYDDLPRDPVYGRRAERWVLVGVQEAYIHCSKFIPRLAKRSPGGDRPGRPGFFVAQPPGAPTSPAPLTDTGVRPALTDAGVRAPRPPRPRRPPQPVRWPAHW
jgi:predicted pyridoxine 5'-phosphate oxidase superfamily flavin-nucleotide-binding protein